MDEYGYVDDWLIESLYWIGYLSGKYQGEMRPLSPRNDLFFSAYIYYGIRMSISFSEGHPCFKHQIKGSDGWNVLQFRLENSDSPLRIQDRILDFYPDILISSKFGECCAKAGHGCSSVVSMVKNEWVCDRCEKIMNHDGDASGFVYIVGSSSDGLYKIGCSKNHQKRIESISPKLPFELDVIKTLYCADKYEGERLLHSRFNEYRTRGEWFRLPDSEINGILSHHDKGDDQ